MLSFVIFCHIWFLLAGLINGTENSTGLQAGSLRSEDRPSPPGVTRFSVPEGHHVCLQCGGSDSPDVFWTFQDKKVLVTRQGSYETNKDHQRYRLLFDGGFCLLQLSDSDGGGYCCNHQLVAELQVLTGHNFTVSTGRTLLLPCLSSKPKQRWLHQRVGGKAKVILTRFRNGTVKPDRDGSRLSFTNGALQIQDLQPADAGEYVCNTVLQARVTVLTVDPEPTSIQSSTSTAPTPAETKTDVVEIKREKKRPENALLLVAVVGLGLMIVLLAAVCVLLSSMKCRRKKKYRYAAEQRREDTELQPWRTSSGQTECEVFESPSLPEEAIHYASLGRQNWTERPGRTPPNQSHSVIYSSVITRPAGRETPNTNALY